VRGRKKYEGAFMEIHMNKERGAVIVSVKGRMDAITSVDFEKSLSVLISKGESHFLIDLSELDYISSAGLRAILKISRLLKTQNGKILFAGLQDLVREVFKISGFDTIFQICETVEEALNG
jgi:anti-anti-sigma factor